MHDAVMDCLLLIVDWRLTSFFPRGRMIFL